MRRRVRRGTMRTATPALLLLLTLLVVGCSRPAPDEPAPTASVPDPDPSATSASPSGPPPSLPAGERGQDVLLHVALDGDDDASGDAATPLATLEEAARRIVAANRDGDDVRLVVSSGVHRGSLDLTDADGLATAATITIEGEPDAVISGADVLTDWTEADDGILRHRWTEAWGPGDPPDSWLESYGARQIQDNPVLLRRELVVVDGLLLHPVATRQELRREVGTYLVDDDQDLLLVNPPPGTGSDATIEVGLRPDLLRIVGRRGVTVRDLAFRHAASPVQRRAIVVGSSADVVLERVDVTANSWGGIGLSRSTDITIRQARLDENGVAGLTANEVDGLVVEDSSTSFNGWRARIGLDDLDTDDLVDATFVDFAGGQKFLYLRDARFTRHRAIGNATSGLWFDFDNRDIVVEDSVLANNGTWGVFVEANPGPVRIADSLLCGNETGVLIANSSDGEVTGSTIAGNRLTQIGVSGSEARDVLDRDTGEVRPISAERWSFTDVRVAADPGAALFLTTLGDAAWQRFRSTSDATRASWTAEPGAALLVGASGDPAGWSRTTGATPDCDEPALPGDREDR